MGPAGLNHQTSNALLANPQAAAPELSVEPACTPAASVLPPPAESSLYRFNTPMSQTAHPAPPRSKRGSLALPYQQAKAAHSPTLLCMGQALPKGRLNDKLPVTDHEQIGVLGPQLQRSLDGLERVRSACKTPTQELGQSRICVITQIRRAQLTSGTKGHQEASAFLCQRKTKHSERQCLGEQLRLSAHRATGVQEQDNGSPALSN